MALKEEVLGPVPRGREVPGRVDVGDREAPLLGLRRPALPAAAQPDVRGHRRLVALLRPHVPPLRHAVRDGLDLQERQRLPVHRGDPGRGRPRRSPRRSTTSPRRPWCPRTRTTPRRSGRTSAPSCRRTASSSRTGGAIAWSRRCSATSTTSRACSTSRTSSSLMELACLLEDAIDIHDRHWKIHWMLNFAQLSATLNLRAVMEKTHGKIDEVSSSAASRTRPRTATGTRSRPSGR